ncbi:MAG: excinuclease ABC subunit C, partial [Bacilli bacterium]|nr:excinuclease ABC subunit C [Bacilli bacterium]
KDGNTYPLERKGRLFFLLMRMQDEVHRYAIAFHKEARGKKMVKSILDDISGLGEKRKELLRTHYPTLEEMMMASKEELSQILPKEVADHVYSKLHKEGE